MNVAGDTFRDPDGSLRLADGKVLRFMRDSAAERFRGLIRADVVQRLVADGRLVSTQEVSLGPNVAVPASSVAFEHEKVDFISYPCEWSPITLARAGEFTLELSLELLAAGYQLKDATPANVLFRGTRPIWVDVPSITERPTGSYLWRARRQFEACYLLPLLANVHAGLPIYSSLQDGFSGLDHSAAARLIGARRWMNPQLIRLVALPAALAQSNSAESAAGRDPRDANDARARFVLERMYRGLLADIRALAAKCGARDSAWNQYQSTRSHYADTDLVTKRKFVSEALGESAPSWTLDIGANSGEFSELAAASGSQVVAIDVDEVAAGSIHRAAQAKSLAIHPLVVNFARPTPAFGWNNRETHAFTSRVAGRFDMTLMLAVIHHLRVSNGIPIDLIFDAVAACTKNLIVEYVPPTDPMFVRIARGREPLYEDCGKEAFEASLKRRFEVKRTQDIDNGRVLYFAGRKSASS